MFKLRLLSFVGIISCGLLVNCGDDKHNGQNASQAGSAGKSSRDSQAGQSALGDNGGAGGADGTAIREPLYVVSTGVLSGDDFLGYLAPIRSLEGGGTFDLDDAAELGGLGWVFNRPGDNSIYVASLNDPTIIRWEVTDDGKFVKHETLDFGNLGVGSAYLAASTPIFSSTKSYFADEDQDQIVIWNPESMAILGTIPLGDEDDGNLRPIPEGAFLVHGDKLVVTVGWRDADDTSLYGDHLRLVVIDTNRDEIVASQVEARNVQAALSTVASDGSAYYSPGSLLAAFTEIGSPHGAAPLVMRVLPRDQAFDSDFLLDLSKLVGGRPAGDYTLLDDETALIRVWHPELVDAVDPENWQEVLWGQAGFKWWRWRVGDKRATEIENQTPGSQGATVFKIDGKTYTVRYADGLASTDLIEITAQGEFLPAITAPGAIVGAGVLRIH